MTAAENRRRIAALQAGPTYQNQLGPGLLGSEVIALHKLGQPKSARHPGKTEYKGGWRSSPLRLGQ